VSMGRSEEGTQISKRERGCGVTESKQRPGTKVYWIVQKQSGKRKMNTLRHLRSFLALKCWTVLHILPSHPQGLEREVVIYPIVAVHSISRSRMRVLLILLPRAIHVIMKL
jgi:hypothetical protein